MDYGLGLKSCALILLSVLTVTTLSVNDVFAEDVSVSIPFGAYSPEFDTPANVWYDPPVIHVNVGDTVIWTNDDREGHTVTSGQSAGRWGWMGFDDFGEPDGYFDSGRFLTGESWSFTFEDAGTFSYYCIIHPWMEGWTVVGNVIPEFPHDAFGNKIEKFPIVRRTADQTVKVTFSWEPKIIKTNEKVTFIYRFYDGATDHPLAYMGYNIRIIQNGNELYADHGVSGVGGDYRNMIFAETGPVIVKFENINQEGRVSETRSLTTTTNVNTGKLVDFSVIAHENPDITETTEIVVQPTKRVQFSSDLALLIVVVPSMMLIIAVMIARKRKPDYLTYASSKKSSPV